MKIQREWAIAVVLGIGSIVCFMEGGSGWNAVPKAEGMGLMMGAVEASTQMLQEAGLSDVSKCEYRVITIRVRPSGPYANDAFDLVTRGWVLPEETGKKTRKAVAWNGVVYPVLKLGEKADVVSDAKGFIAADAQAVAERRKASPKGEARRDQRVFLENETAGHTVLSPGKAYMLVQAGELNLAEEAFKQWAAVPGSTYKLSDNLRVYFAREWVWAQFDRSIGAFLERDYEVAGEQARECLASAARLTKLLQAQGIEMQPEFTGKGYASYGKYLEFVEPANGIVKDSARRLGAPAAKALAADADKRQRIAWLIGALEDVRVEQSSEPGWLNFQADATCAELVRMGRDAVPALLDCLERDERLTRSLFVHRSGLFHREIVPVHVAAHDLLAAILKERFDVVNNTQSAEFREGDEAARKVVAAKARARWEVLKVDAGR